MEGYEYEEMIDAIVTTTKLMNMYVFMERDGDFLELCIKSGSSGVNIIIIYIQEKIALISMKTPQGEFHSNKEETHLNFLKDILLSI